MSRVAELQWQRVKVADLRPHPRNPRKHPSPGSKMWDVMRRSLDQIYFDPLIWNRRNGMLVGGHLRAKVMQELGFDEADVVVVDLDEAQHLAVMTNANRSYGEWDEEVLSAILSDVELAGIDSSLAGFDTKEMMAMLEPPTVEDDSEQAEELVTAAVELQEKWQVKLGDVYGIGDHRLMCGDCASVDNWTVLLEGRDADMVWTDPPYNVAYHSLQKHRQEVLGSGRKEEELLNDDVSDKEYAALLLSWMKAAYDVTKPGGGLYVAHAESYGLTTRRAVEEAGWYQAQTLIWVKNSFTLGRQDYQWQHEPILYGWKRGGPHYWQGGYSQSTIIYDEESLKNKSKAELIVMINQMRNARDTTVVREATHRGESLHPTMKPVPLVARHIWNSSRRGETVIDLFGGSGTTLVAAHKVGRKAAATELDPKFCAVILERMTKLGLEVVKLHGD